uniref:Ig-like domain-containing protein n=1 Tax=Xenopus tropicalis TaxID=8364 RepID=A0A6I8SSE0_XENTR
MNLWLSAVICTCITGLLVADKVEQDPIISTKTGENVILNCTYETAYSNPYLHWYIQRPGERPHFILHRHQFKEEDEPGGKYSAKLHKESKSIDLRISGVSESDSGLYYCALSPTVSLSAASSVQEALALPIVLLTDCIYDLICLCLCSTLVMWIININKVCLTYINTVSHKTMGALIYKYMNLQWVWLHVHYYV